MIVVSHLPNLSTLYSLHSSKSCISCFHNQKLSRDTKFFKLFFPKAYMFLRTSLDNFSKKMLKLCRILLPAKAHGKERNWFRLHWFYFFFNKAVTENKPCIFCSIFHLNKQKKTYHKFILLFSFGYYYGVGFGGDNCLFGFGNAFSIQTVWNQPCFRSYEIRELVQIL